jgi:hypothetical protein
MKFIKNKYELSEFSLLLIWFQCEPHWWCYTRQKKTDLIPNISRHLPSTDSQASGMRILSSLRFCGIQGWGVDASTYIPKKSSLTFFKNKHVEV